MSTGWIKLHRQLLGWEWYDDMNTKCLYLHCLLRANHSNTKWRGIEVKRGQFITSLETLSSETGLSIQKIRTSLSKLKSTGNVTSKQQAKARILTVLGYDSYQDDNKESNKQVTGNQQGNNREVTTDKNVRTKECKNEKKEVINNRFAEFWDLYGKKVDRPKCENKFSKLSENEINLIFTKLPDYIKSKPEKQYRKDPIRWLTGKCWNDEVILPANQAKSTHTFETQNYQSGKF